MIDKNKTIRFFQKKANQLLNPDGGTLIDNGIVEKDGKSLFDFYLVSNENPNSACARPVHYQVVYNSTDFTKEEI